MNENENIVLVSVIITTRETPLMLLKRCVQCVQQQTLPNVEIILLDANASDSPWHTAIQGEDKLLEEIHYISFPEEGELVHGKQKALQAVSGEYVTFLSAQDYMPPSRLEYVIKAFRENPAAFMYYTNMRPQKNHILETSDLNMPSGRLNFLSQIIFHRDCFSLIGSFDDNLVALCDEEIWFRIQYLGLVNHLNSDETVIDICPDEYKHYTPLQAAIGGRQLRVKYNKYFKKNKKSRKKLYADIAANYKKSNVIFRYIQFKIKAWFTRS